MSQASASNGNYIEASEKNQFDDIAKDLGLGPLYWNFYIRKTYFEQTLAIFILQHAIVIYLRFIAEC